MKAFQCAQTMTRAPQLAVAYAAACGAAIAPYHARNPGTWLDGLPGRLKGDKTLLAGALVDSPFTWESHQSYFEALYSRGLAAEDVVQHAVRLDRETRAWRALLLGVASSERRRDGGRGGSCRLYHLHAGDIQSYIRSYLSKSSMAQQRRAFDACSQVASRRRKYEFHRHRSALADDSDDEGYQEVKRPRGWHM